MIPSRERAVQKGKPVVVNFFGEYVLRGTVEDVDKTKAMIAFGQGTLGRHRSSQLDSTA
jgi:hypothetical protein